VARREIHELPAARGCTYVVPAADYALALACARAQGDGEMAVARTLGVTDAEIDRLCDAVVAALAGDAREPDAIRAAVGGAARSLGEAGKKKGLSTTLPLALGRLQAAGRIRRVPADGRLDRQRYRYARWDDAPRWPDGGDPFAALARRYFAERPGHARRVAVVLGARRAGRARGGRAVRPRARVARVGPAPAPRGRGRVPRLRRARRPGTRWWAASTRCSPPARARHAARPGRRRPPCRAADGRAGGAGRARASCRPASHAIVDAGVVGLWEYDADAGEWLGHLRRATMGGLRAAVAATALRARHLGDGARQLEPESRRARRAAAARRASARRTTGDGARARDARPRAGGCDAATSPSPPFAHESRSPTVRLNTGAPGRESAASLTK
jgi:hypothetical protein